MLDSGWLYLQATCLWQQHLPLCLHLLLNLLLGVHVPVFLSKDLTQILLTALQNHVKYLTSVVFLIPAPFFPCLSLPLILPTVHWSLVKCLTYATYTFLRQRLNTAYHRPYADLNPIFLEDFSNTIKDELALFIVYALTPDAPILESLVFEEMEIHLQEAFEASVPKLFDALMLTLHATRADFGTNHSATSSILIDDAAVPSTDAISSVRLPILISKVPLPASRNPVANAQSSSLIGDNLTWTPTITDKLDLLTEFALNPDAPVPEFHVFDELGAFF